MKGLHESLPQLDKLMLADMNSCPAKVQHLKAELELKTKVLLLPVDACVKQAQHGNTVRC